MLLLTPHAEFNRRYVILPVNFWFIINANDFGYLLLVEMKYKIRAQIKNLQRKSIKEKMLLFLFPKINVTNVFWTKGRLCKFLGIKTLNVLWMKMSYKKMSFPKSFWIFFSLFRFHWLFNTLKIFFCIWNRYSCIPDYIEFHRWG